MIGRHYAVSCTGARRAISSRGFLARSLRASLMTAPALLAAAASASTISAASAPSEPKALTRPLEIGTTHAIQSKALGEERILNVILPPGYGADSERRYPVLYLIDGGAEQDLLSIAGAAQSGAIWGRSAEAIIVGIETKDRRKELAGPTSNPALLKRYPTAGASAKFREFIRAEGKPFVEARYRTNGYDAVIGESLAGLFIVETYLTAPDLFDDYAAIDPSLWWDDGALSRSAAGHLGIRQRSKKLLIAAAKEQLNEPEAYSRFLTAIMHAGVELCLLPRPDQTHATIYQQLAPSVLQFLLPPKNSSPPEYEFTVGCRLKTS